MMTQPRTRRGKLPQSSNQFVSIYIRNYAKKTIVVKVPPKVKVQILKQNVKQKMRIPLQDQALFLNGHHITQQMDQIEVDNKLIFHLVNLKRISLGRMTIMVKRIQKDSPSFKYHVKSEMLISQFIRQQFAVDYPDYENYFLVYTGRQILPDNTFKQEFVEDNSEVMCVHRIQDRKSQFIEIKRIPVANKEQLSMIKKKFTEQAEEIPSLKERKQMKISANKMQNQNQNQIKTQQQSIQPLQEIKHKKLQIEQQPNLQPTSKQQKEEQQLLKQKETIQETEKFSKSQNEQQQKNQISKDKQIQDDYNEEDDQQCQQILITNKQQYSIISKDKPRKQNPNVRKKMRSNFAAPEPLRDDEEEEEMQQRDEEGRRTQLSASNLRDNTHLGLTVISSRHDQEQSIQPNQMSYRHLFNKEQDKEKQNVGTILRTHSQPLRLSELADEYGKTDSHTQTVKQEPNQEQKISLLQPRQENIIVVVEDVEVCEAIKEPEQPNLNYDIQGTVNYEQKNIESIPEEDHDQQSKQKYELRDNNIQNLDLLQKESEENQSIDKAVIQKTQSTFEYKQIMKQRISQTEPVRQALQINLGENKTFQITDLKPTRPVNSPPRVYNVFNPHITQEQQPKQKEGDKDRQKNSQKDNDDSQIIREPNKNDIKQQAIKKKKLKQDSESMLLDNSQEIGENDENLFSDKFQWNNLKDQKNLIDLSAQLQDVGLTEIVPGKNIQNWEKLSFSFRNSQVFQFNPGDIIILGNSASLGVETIQEDLYAEFQQNLARIQSLQI